MNYSFCPKCGHSLDVRSIDDVERLVCANCDFIFYQNSKPCSSVLVLNQNKLLLVQRAIEPFKDYWDIPGGFLEAGEHPKDGAIREIEEETGLRVNLVDDLGVFMGTYGEGGGPILNFCYIAQVVDGEPQAASDATQIKWFDLQALPDKIAFDWSNEALDLLKARYPGLPDQLAPDQASSPPKESLVKAAAKRNVTQELPVVKPVDNTSTQIILTKKVFAARPPAQEDVSTPSQAESDVSAAPALPGGIFGGQAFGKQKTAATASTVSTASDDMDDSKTTVPLPKIGGVLQWAINERVGRSVDTLYVDAAYQDVERGTAEQPYRTITQALDQAIGGITIVVAPGIYWENIRLKEEVRVVSQITGAAVIHGGADQFGGRPAVIGANRAEVIGFTIVGGFIGVLCEGTSAIFKHNVIRGNYGDYGLVCRNQSRTVIQNNTILANLGSETNGLSIGIYVEDADPKLYNNIISGNSIGFVSYHGNPVERYNNIWGNRRNFGHTTKLNRRSISVDPEFVDPSVGDYRLRPTSPCGNAGRDPKDDTLRSIGAFEPIQEDAIETARTTLPEAAIAALQSFPYLHHIRHKRGEVWKSALDEHLGHYWAMPGDELLLLGDRLMSSRHASRWFVQHSGEMGLPMVHFGNIRQPTGFDASGVEVADQPGQQQFTVKVPPNAVSGWVFVKRQGLESNPLYLEIRRP